MFPMTIAGKHGLYRRALSQRLMPARQHHFKQIEELLKQHVAEFAANASANESSIAAHRWR